MNRVADITLCIWFLVVGISFWGTYFGLVLPSNMLAAFYAVFLLIAVVRLTLSLLRQKPE